VAFNHRDVHIPIYVEGLISDFLLVMGFARVNIPSVGLGHVMGSSGGGWWRWWCELAMHPP